MMCDKTVLARAEDKMKKINSSITGSESVMSIGRGWWF
jgi:hypothetical protein